jgi:hypothetical protein
MRALPSDRSVQASTVTPSARADPGRRVDELPTGDWIYEPGLDFDALLARIHPAGSRVARLSRETPARFVAFDVIACEGEDLQERPTEPGCAAMASPDMAARGVEDGCPELNVRGGLPIVLVERACADSISTTSFCGCPNVGPRSELESMGFDRRDGRLAVGDRGLRIVDGAEAEPERPLLNHIALLVDSAAEVRRDADRRGVTVDDVKYAENTLAVFLRGPTDMRIE